MIFIQLNMFGLYYKMKKRVDREKKVKYSLRYWILNLDFRVYFKGS